MRPSATLHSRSVLAGYDPDRIRAAKVLVAGVGALGQNVVQNLALIGVGGLLLIDFDDFEDHNATRSPFFPAPADRRRLGLSKARVVAHRAVDASTAAEPRLYFLEDLVQAAGDGAVAWADVVVCAVDNVSARAWLAERCRVLGKPMVEGGFSGPQYNVAAFSGRSGEVCYRCGNPDRESSASCTQYALAAEAAHIVPAIQTTAAAAAALQIAPVIPTLHGNEGFTGRCVYGDIRVPSLSTVRLQVSPSCPGWHEPLPVIGKVEAAALADIGRLTQAVRAAVGPCRIQMTEPALIDHNCTRCGTLARVLATEASWLRAPLCADCGGPWPASPARFPDRALFFDTEHDLDEAFAAADPAAFGLRPGGRLMVATGETAGQADGIVELGGAAEDWFQRAEPAEVEAEAAGEAEAVDVDVDVVTVDGDAAEVAEGA